MKDQHLNTESEELSLNHQIDDQNEFPDSIPVLDYLNDSLKKNKANRRSFLKTMGFSISAAALAASCEIPVRKAIPYIDKPEEVTPGKALYYASSYFDGATFSSLLVKTRDGRPIKVEGNKNSPITHGVTNAAVQASVISLYDHTRFQSPLIDGNESSWDDVVSGLKNDLRSVSGDVVLLTGPVISPSIKAAIEQFKATYNAKHVVYSAAKNDALLIANEQSFGKKAAPVYKFENADVIASFGADFLGNWLGGTNFYSKGYSQNRKVSVDNPKMSKHYQVESYMSLTGSNADKRLSVKPSQLKAVLFQLHNIIASKTGGSSVNGVPQTENEEYLNELATSLLAARGKSIVATGINDVDAQKVTNSINSMLGNYGSTIDFSRTLNIIQGDNNDFSSLAGDIKAGRVGALLMHGANPMYSSPMGEEVEAELSKVKVIASFDSAPNESNLSAKYILPDSNYLESWGDYEPVTGSFTVQQPTIQPLFKTKNFGESLLMLANHDFGQDGDFYAYMQETWKSAFGADGFQKLWDESVRTGFNHNEGVPVFEASGVDLSGVSFKSTDLANFEVVLFEDKLGNGEYASNPYMQELPDPVSKVSWDNYAAISPSTARENGWSEFNRNVKPGNEKAPVISIAASNGKTIELPILIMPGMPKNVIGIPVGYGRTFAGLVGSGIGVNAHQIASVENGLVSDVASATITQTGRKYELAQSQLHYTINDDRVIVKEATLEDFKKDPQAGNYDRYLSEFRHAFGEDVTLYPEREYPGHKWGMNIDLNSCFGCGACVVSCNIENNIPVVGKEEVAMQRDMHWLRIDRYFASADQDPHSDTYLEDPSVVFMPMMCQHCDNAPCENVCPVNATNHSSEGLNQMSYNRCIGTRYCANNCPFKVRRFNWFDYWGADSFGGANDLDKNEINAQMRNDFSRMILNPDVTVRSRGVIEKCSFCVQRIQENKLDAKLKGEPLDANAIKTACQSACPADAIVFGDTNNSNSEVNKLQNDVRNYFVLEEFHVLPSVGYLTKVTNSDKALFDQLPKGHFAHSDRSGDGHGDTHGEEHGTDSHGETDSHSEGNKH